MNKEEILNKSREENRNKDYFGISVDKTAANVGAVTASIVALILYLLQIFTGGGLNYSLWAVMVVLNSGKSIYKAFKLKNKKEKVIAVLWTASAIIVTGIALFYLFNPQSAEWLRNERYRERY